MKLILASHSDFAKGIKSAAEMIAGPQEDIYTFGMRPDEDMAMLEAEIREVVNTFPEGEEILVLTDMFFGSPFNTVVSMMRDTKLYHVTGMNLTMVLEAATHLNAGRTAKEVGEEIMESAVEGIISANEQLGL